MVTLPNVKLLIYYDISNNPYLCMVLEELWGLSVSGLFSNVLLIVHYENLWLCMVLEELLIDFKKMFMNFQQCDVFSWSYMFKNVKLYFILNGFKMMRMFMYD